MKETREQYQARKERQRQEYEQRRSEKRRRLQAALERKKIQFQKNQEFKLRLEDSISRVLDERYLVKGRRKERLLDKFASLDKKRDEVISQGATLCRQVDEIEEKLNNT